MTTLTAPEVIDWLLDIARIDGAENPEMTTADGGYLPTSTDGVPMVIDRVSGRVWRIQLDELT